MFVEASERYPSLFTARFTFILWLITPISLTLLISFAISLSQKEYFCFRKELYK